MAAANVTVAATYVASVLEHMGYLTQNEFLQNFQDFFRDAGALIYLLAAIGGVFSVAMYGSFRAARYLLVGPALFWFLVGPTTESGGVLWKVGGGEYLGMLRKQGEQSSKDFRKKTLDKLAKGEEADGEIDVALGFWLFAKPINDVMNKAVDIILHKENAADLTANAKVRGLELISHIMPYEQDQIQHIEEFMSGCSQMLEQASALAEYRVRLRGKAALGARGVNVATTEIDEKANFYLEKLKLTIDKTMPLASSGLQDPIKWMQGATGAEAAAIGPIIDKYKDGTKTDITCGDAWAIIATETWFRSKKEIATVLRMASGNQKFQDARQEVCEELTRKTQDDQEAPECNLAPAIAMFTLYNHFRHIDNYSRVFARHKNQRDYLNPKADSIITGPIQRGMKPARTSSFGGTSQPMFRRGTNAFGHEFQEQLFIDSEMGPRDTASKVMWAPVAPISQLRGMDHAMWVATRQYESVKLRQQIITYALQLPYYQGAVLFLIAVIYPFMALIVLLPGRAHHFLNVPLAWLWAKSWDVGFAVVVVLDKVMYNLLPNWALDESLRTGPWIEPEKLADVLTQGNFFDPWGSIHMYYTIIGMVTLGIPVLTGAMTLKARKGILSSFTDAAAGQARSRGERAAAGFSVQAQSERNFMMMEVKGLAKLMAQGGAGGIAKNARGRVAGFYALANIAPGLLNQTNLGKAATGDIGELAQSLPRAAKGMQDYHGAMASSVPAYAKYGSGLTSHYNPMLGRFGKIQMYEEAYAAAMDGGGVYELSGANSSALDDFLKVAGEQADSRMTAKASMQGVLAGKVLSGVVSTTNSKASNMAPSLAGFLAAWVIADKADGKNSSASGPSLQDVKEKLGLNMNDDAAVAVLLSKDRFMYQSAAGRRELESFREYNEKQKELLGDAWLFGRVFDDIYGVLSTKGRKYLPYGGSSEQMEIYMRAYGPERMSTNIEMRNPMMGEDGVMLTDAQFKALLPKIDDAHPSGRLDAARKRYGMDNFVETSQGARDQSILITQVAGSIGAFASATEQRSKDYNQELYSDFIRNRTIGAGSGWRQEDYNRRRREVENRIINYVGGGARVAEIWNGLGRKRTLSFDSGAGTFAFSDGSEFTSRDLMIAVSGLSEQLGAYNRNRFAYGVPTSELTEAQRSVLGNADAYDRIGIEGSIDLSEIPKFIRGKERISIVQVMESAPMAALQVAEDWARTYANSPSPSAWDYRDVDKP